VAVRLKIDESMQNSEHFDDKKRVALVYSNPVYSDMFGMLRKAASVNVP